MTSDHEFLPHLVVVSRTTADESIDESGEPKLNFTENEADANDTHNHPRLRRVLILQAIKNRTSAQVSFVAPPQPEDDIQAYESVHSRGLLTFLSTAWSEWEKLGEERRDPDCFLSATSSPDVPPPLVPCNVPLPRDVYQRPSRNVMGAVGYYCTDLCTPIVSMLLQELRWDAAAVRLAVEQSFQARASYALTTHPGHHAARDSFGGYCYINHAAHTVQMFRNRLGGQARVAILDVDYHCGNGTASIFYEDPTALVVSIHCDPDFEYPFHSGFADQQGSGEGNGTTLHLPLPPGTSWTVYESALNKALDRIVDFGANALVVSLGLDTHEGDQVAIRRAGFCLSGNDYWKMGQTIGSKILDIPTVFIQEGGYRMDFVGDAAAGVVVGFCAE